MAADGAKWHWGQPGHEHECGAARRPRPALGVTGSRARHAAAPIVRPRRAGLLRCARWHPQLARSRNHFRPGPIDTKAERRRSAHDRAYAAVEQFSRSSPTCSATTRPHARPPSEPPHRPLNLPVVAAEPAHGPSPSTGRPVGKRSQPALHRRRAGTSMGRPSATAGARLATLAPRSAPTRSPSPAALHIVAGPSRAAGTRRRIRAQDAGVVQPGGEASRIDGRSIDACGARRARYLRLAGHL